MKLSEEKILSLKLSEEKILSLKFSEKKNFKFFYNGQYVVLLKYLIKTAILDIIVDFYKK